MSDYKHPSVTVWSNLSVVELSVEIIEECGVQLLTPLGSSIPDDVMVATLAQAASSEGGAFALAGFVGKLQPLRE